MTTVPPYIYTLSLHDALPIFSRYGYRLPLGDLAYGDTSAPVGNVYQWATTTSDPNVQKLGALVSRIGPGLRADAAFSAIDPQLDRKSTRLNSSHLGISYAVFC